MRQKVKNTGWKSERIFFVFHAEYIADLPDDYKADFAMYAINYALNDEQPPLMQGTLEYSLWAKIERRIDQEREKYERVKENAPQLEESTRGTSTTPRKLKTRRFPKRKHPQKFPQREPKRQSLRQRLKSRKRRSL